MYLTPVDLHMLGISRINTAQKNEVFQQGFLQEM